MTGLLKYASIYKSMSKKILCPAHEDHEPSMHVYGDMGFCFVCKASIPIAELNIPENKIPKPEPTNVAERIKYIQSLPTKIIRGLQLPYDNSGYYIVWPNQNYYKRRNFEGKVRYIAPSGVKPPLFVCPGTSTHLIICEGEINALTLYNCISMNEYEYKVISPGPASDFLRHIKYYLSYSKITIIADYDAAGIVFGYQLKDLLLKNKKRCTLALMRDDFNRILQDKGEQAVRDKFEAAIA